MRFNFLRLAALALGLSALLAGNASAADFRLAQPAVAPLATGAAVTKVAMVLAPVAKGDNMLEKTQGRRFRGGGGGRVVRRGGGRRGIGKGLAIGLGAAAALAIVGAAAANAESGRGRCRRWAYLCDDGEGWACRKYSRYCD
jgi:hypothetical protein